MYVKITKEHLRRCPECLQLCLKVADPYDGHYHRDDEELGVCSDCLEDLAAAVPAERFVQLLAETADPEMLSQVTESSEMEN